MHAVVGEIVIMDASDAAQKRLLREAKARYPKLRVFDTIALGYSEPLRMYAHKKCTGEWILFLGSDQRLTKPLKQNIGKLISDKRYNALAIKSIPIRDGKKTSSFAAWQIQLYRKNAIEYKGMIHEQPTVRGLIKRVGGEMFLEHHIDMEHTGAKDYQKMEGLRRMTYKSYNAALVDHASKLIMPQNRTIENTRTGKLIKALLLSYEKLTLRNLDKEISGFDYFLFYLLRESAYACMHRNLKSILNVLPSTMYFYGFVSRSRNSRYSKEMFEVSKIISNIGVIRFLNLDDEKVVERLAAKYKNRRQGADLLISLLLEKYRETQNAQEREFRYQNIVISPHSDDAFFSLGGMLAKERRMPQKVVDVFSRSRYARKGWSTFSKMTPILKKNERENARKVGARVEFLDYESGESRSGFDNPERAAQLYKRLKGYLNEGRRVFFPLAISSHGDHIILSLVGLRLLRDTGRENIYFYEDLPYAIKTTKPFMLVRPFLGASVNSEKLYPLIDTRRDVDWLESECINVDHDAKLELCKTYKSQIDWGIITSIIFYGRMLGALVGFKERVWKVSNPERARELLGRHDAK